MVDDIRVDRRVESFAMRVLLREARTSDPVHDRTSESEKKDKVTITMHVRPFAYCASICLSRIYQLHTAMIVSLITRHCVINRVISKRYTEIW